MTNSEVTQPVQVVSTFTEASGVLSESLLSFMKIVEYLCLAAFIGTGILSFISLGNQLVLIWAAVLLSGSIFFILLNRKLLADYKRDNYEAKMSRKAEIYGYLLAGTSIATDSLKPAREMALQY